MKEEGVKEEGEKEEEQEETGAEKGDTEKGRKRKRPENCEEREIRMRLFEICSRRLGRSPGVGFRFLLRP